MVTRSAIVWPPPRHHPHYPSELAPYMVAAYSWFRCWPAQMHKEKTMRARLRKIAATSGFVLVLAAGGAGVATAATTATPPALGPGTHHCGQGLHPKQQPAGSGANIHQCGHGLHRGQHLHDWP